MHTPDHRTHDDEHPHVNHARALIDSAGVDEHHVRREHHRATWSNLCEGIAHAARERDYDQSRVQFPDEEIHLENGHTPYIRVRQDVWELRYFPPSAVEIHESGHGHRDGFSLHDDLDVPLDALASITTNDLRGFLGAWIAACPRGTPSLDSHAEVLSDLRGSMDDGYDQDRVNKVLGRLNETFGTRLVCLWDYVDPFGFGGDSNFYLEDTRGRLRELVGDLWGWLKHPVDAPPGTAIAGPTRRLGRRRRHRHRPDRSRRRPPQPRATRPPQRLAIVRTPHQNKESDMDDEHYATLTVVDCSPNTAPELGDRLRDAGFLTEAERYRTDPDAPEQPPSPARS
ncbi:hypothetical protein [Embleya sp. NPDC059237]|uniref:hypothetical protein n=1 Tax=Embleya sp. NPDC059237 TaxID=3346784 RepID=UPI0036A82FD3